MLWIYRLFTEGIYRAGHLYGKARSEAGNQLWKGRLGLIGDRPARRIWLHAASVGEVRVTGYLVEYLLKRRPDLTFHITTMTKAGFNTALTQYQSPNISPAYFPIDAVSAVRKTLDAVKPELIVIAETEIWPNLISEASSRGIPIILVNARMTARALGRYRWFRSTMKSLLNKYDRFFFKADDDAQRYYRLGMDPSKGVVLGDMKFDAPMVARTEEKMRQIRQQAGISMDAFLFVAGSTRPGEEAIIANVFRELTAQFENLAVVIAPRHIERIDEVKSLLKDKAVEFAIYGNNPHQHRVVLVDRLGLLNDFYLAADLAFVGGTLVDIGGHNVLEPVWAGCPVIFGPSLFNVQEAADYIVEHNFGAIADSQEDLVSLLKNILAGDIIYARKSSNDSDKSPTTVVGEYILDKLKSA